MLRNRRRVAGRSRIAQQSEARRTKLRELKEACLEDPVNIDALRRLAKGSGGCLNRATRRSVWPWLLGIHPDSVAHATPLHELPTEHDEAGQVCLDVNRSLWRYPAGIRHHERLELRRRLSTILNALLRRHHDLRYYQGLHDVCSVFLLVMDDDVAFCGMERCCQTHLRDFLQPSLATAMAHLDLVFALLARTDAELFRALQESGMESAHFALSWVITWFSHVLDDFETICRVFDYCLASHPLAPVYLSAAIIGAKRDVALRAEREYHIMFKILNTAPATMDVERVIQEAEGYMKSSPPELLLGLPSIPAPSAALLRKSRSLAEFQRLERRLHSQHQTYVPGREELPPGQSTPMQLAALAIGAAAWALGVYFLADP